jgi:nicotinamidase-related amidase
MLIDVQYDFLPPDGVLQVANGRSILPTVYRLLDERDFDLVVASQVCRTHRQEMDMLLTYMHW